MPVKRKEVITYECECDICHEKFEKGDVYTALDNYEYFLVEGNKISVSFNATVNADWCLCKDCVRKLLLENFINKKEEK